jgi:hypothetical protein
VINSDRTYQLTSKMSWSCHLLSTIILIFLSSSSFGQDLENFTTLESKGPLPSDFVELSLDKYQDAIHENHDEELDKEFFLDSRFFVDKLLLGGNVLFNEECSEYVKDVAKYVLKDQPELFNKLRFYVLKSNIANAFSTDQGIIFVTTALLARVENEAQLAFILAHEISHFTENHVRKSYKKEQQIESGTEKYEKDSYNEKIASLSAYSRDHELRADKKGMEMMLNTEYSTDALFGAFEMLLYSYLPFEDKNVSKTFLDSKHLEIPKDRFECEIKEIIQYEDVDDKNSTHPNIQSRMDGVYTHLNDRTSLGNLKFKISQEKFERVQLLARFDEINILLTEREYGRALYSVYILQETFPKNKFLELSKIKALYGLVKYKNHDRYDEVIVPYEDSEGEISKLHYFIENISKVELNVICYRHAYDAKEKYFTDIFRLYEKDILKELAVNSDLPINELQPLSYKDFLITQKNGPTFDIKDSIVKIDNSDLSKFSKIKLKKKLRAMKIDTSQTYTLDEDYYLFCLSDIVQNDGLKEKLKTNKSDSNRNNNGTSRTTSSSNVLGLRKIVIVDPIFEIFDKNQQRQHIESEKMKMETSDAYLKKYPKLKIDRTILDSKNLNDSNIETYNHIGILFHWVMEIIEHKDIDMISSTHDRMNELTEFYETSHFVFTGIFVYKNKHKLFTRYFTEITAFSVNAEKDYLENGQSEIVLSRIKGIQLESYIFDILYNLNH